MSQEVFHYIAAADYSEFQRLIMDLPPNHGQWLARHDATRAARERQSMGSFAIVRVWPEEFRLYLRPHKSSSEWELWRFARQKHAAAHPGRSSPEFHSGISR